MLKNFQKAFSQNKLLVLLIFTGSLSWSLTMIKSGIVYKYGMGFWGANGHDGIWHIALINHLSKGSLSVPVFAGESLHNYHIGFDLLLAFIHNITQIPVSVLYFQIFPPIAAMLIGSLVYKFVHLWKKSKNTALWATFFVYFGGNFGWIVTLLRDQSIGGESMFWSQQSISTLINPPFALSLIFIFAGLICLIKKKTFLAIILFGLLIQIKVYAGILCLGALFTSGLYEYLKNKQSLQVPCKNIIILKIFVGVLIVSLILFLPLYSPSSSLIIFKPFWFIETMMQLSDRVGWSKFGIAMVDYKTGHIWIKGFIAYAVAFGIFIIGNFGTRLMFIKKIKYKQSLQVPCKSINYIEVFIFSIILMGIIIPTLFVQKGTAWNTIQFFYYSLIFSGILAGIAIADIKIKYVKYLIIIFTVPTTIGAMKHYLPNTPPAALPTDEVEALNFLSQQSDGIVLTYPYVKFQLEEETPRPIYKYTSTSYVAAFSEKQVFLEDEMNLEITDFDWKTRRAEIENFYASLDQDFVRNFLHNNNIKYLYWVDGQRATLGETQLGLERIFENERVDIYKVVK